MTPMPGCVAPAVQRQPIQEEDEEKVVHMKESPGHPPTVKRDVQTQIDAIRGSGQPLPESVRSFFEPRFGYDFSRVRVHADTRAAESAQAQNARAYTIGSSIVFGAGEYQLATNKGRRLLAHELTHTLQQTSHCPADRSGASVSVLRRSERLYVARACFNPDICDLFGSRGTCLPLSCGLGGSGVCSFPSPSVGCCCIGSLGRRPEEQVEREKERIRSRRGRRTEPGIPLPELLLIILMIILMRGMPILRPAPGVVPPIFGPPGPGQEPLTANRRRSRSEVLAALGAATRATPLETVVTPRGSRIAVPQGVASALRADARAYHEFLLLVDARLSGDDLQSMAARALFLADSSVIAAVQSVVAHIPSGVLRDTLEARTRESGLG